MKNPSLFPPEYILPPIPKSQAERTRQMEDTIGLLFDWLMNELDWDNPGSIAEKLPDSVNRIAHQSYERWASRQ